MNGDGKTEEGFYTESGRFVNRTVALKLARESGQVKPDQKLIHAAGTKLHSEDIFPWCKLD